MPDDNLLILVLVGILLVLSLHFALNRSISTERVAPTPRHGRRGSGSSAGPSGERRRRPRLGRLAQDFSRDIVASGRPVRPVGVLDVQSTGNRVVAQGGGVSAADPECRSSPTATHLRSPPA